MVHHKQSAQTFMDRLLDEGSKVRCDDSNESFKRGLEVPEFYDEELFKKGRLFFYKHYYAMLLGMLQAFIVIFTVPSVMQMVIMTGMSNTDMKAYKRYVATVYHLLEWLNEDFKPGSDSWTSISEVRRMHNSASKKGKLCGLNNITQMEMAFAQFGFMGFALTRSKQIGIYNATEEEWVSLNHVWRVMGYRLGIEDRFNIHRKSVEETRHICNLFISQVFKPNMERKDKDFMTITRYMLSALWHFHPLINHASWLTFCYGLLSKHDATIDINDDYFKLEGSTNTERSYWPEDIS